MAIVEEAGRMRRVARTLPRKLERFRRISILLWLTRHRVLERSSFDDP